MNAPTAEEPLGPRACLADRRAGAGRTPRCRPRASSAWCRSTELQPEPAQSAQGLPRRGARRAGRVDPRQGRRAADHRASGRSGRLRDRRRRAPLARGAEGRPAHGAGHRARPQRQGGARDRASSRTCSAPTSTPIEEATGYRELIERFDYTPGAAVRDHRQEPQPRRQHAAPAEAARGVQAMVQDGRLTAGHARALIGRDDAEGAGAAHRRREPQRARGRGAGAGG